MLLWRNGKCYEEKSYHCQIYHCLKVKPSFYEKLFQKEKNKLLLWIYARRLSSHLWSNGWQKLPVTGLNWNLWEPQSNLEEKVSPSILKGDFSSRMDPSIFTSIEPLLLDWSSETNWVFPALKSTSHFLLQSTMSRRSDSNSEAISSCCRRSNVWSHLEKRVVSSP